MLMLVTYDVNTETIAGRRRLRRVARACLDYGQRQKPPNVDRWLAAQFAEMAS